jgi:hypothetical protein
MKVELTVVITFARGPAFGIDADVDWTEGVVESTR